MSAEIMLGRLVDEEMVEKNHVIGIFLELLMAIDAKDSRGLLTDVGTALKAFR